MSPPQSLKIEWVYPRLTEAKLAALQGKQGLYDNLIKQLQNSFGLDDAEIGNLSKRLDVATQAVTAGDGENAVTELLDLLHIDFAVSEDVVDDIAARHERGEARLLDSSHVRAPLPDWEQCQAFSRTWVLRDPEGLYTRAYAIATVLGVPSKQWAMRWHVLLCQQQWQNRLALASRLVYSAAALNEQADSVEKKEPDAEVAEARDLASWVVGLLTDDELSTLARYDLFQPVVPDDLLAYGVPQQGRLVGPFAVDRGAQLISQWRCFFERETSPEGDEHISLDQLLGNLPEFPPLAILSVPLCSEEGTLDAFLDSDTTVSPDKQLTVKVGPSLSETDEHFLKKAERAEAKRIQEALEASKHPVAGLFVIDSGGLEFEPHPPADRKMVHDFLGEREWRLRLALIEQAHALLQRARKPIPSDVDDRWLLSLREYDDTLDLVLSHILEGQACEDVENGTRGPSQPPDRDETSGKGKRMSSAGEGEDDTVLRVPKEEEEKWDSIVDGDGTMFVNITGEDPKDSDVTTDEEAGGNVSVVPLLPRKRTKSTETKAKKSTAKTTKKSPAKKGGKSPAKKGLKASAKKETKTPGTKADNSPSKARTQKSLVAQTTNKSPAKKALDSVAKKAEPERLRKKAAGG